MKCGVAINVHEELVDTIRFAQMLDQSHIDQLWIVDFPAPRFAPAVADKIATITSCRIGIGLISPLIYSTDSMVRFLESLVNLHGERFDLLIGPGDQSALRSIGIQSLNPKEIVDKTVKDAIKVRKELIEKGISCRIWLGAQGPRMISESVNADGVLLNFADPSMISWALNHLDTNSKITKGVFIPSYLTKSSLDRVPADFLYSAAVVALGAPSKIVQDLALQEITDGREAFKHSGKIDMEVIDAIGEDSLRRWGLFTNPEGALNYMAQMKKIGIDEIVFGPPLSHSEIALGTLVEAFRKMSKNRL